MSARGYANMTVPEINPAREGYCHPAQSKRTKCACGKAIQLRAVRIRCGCGRLHVRAPGAAIAATGLQPVRAGGKNGCPGTPE